MYTIVFITRRVEGLTGEQFVDHYGGTHFDLATKMPGLVSYQQLLIDAAGRPWPPSNQFDGYDALSIYTFASRDAAEAAFASAEGLATDADTPTFMDWTTILAAPAQVLRHFPSTENEDVHV